ncbi:MAG: hypothetical protein C6W54_01270 [Bacillaceae bacterium]|nr:MAG: hypothetical protein C6W54_01270 [Bacillaceae bacterium]
MNHRKHYIQRSGFAESTLGENVSTGSITASSNNYRRWEEAGLLRNKKKCSKIGNRNWNPHKSSV